MCRSRVVNSVPCVEVHAQKWYVTNELVREDQKQEQTRRGRKKKTKNRQSSPRHGREESRWHRLASAVQAPASHTTPTQQQNQKKKENNQVNTAFTTNKRDKRRSKRKKVICKNEICQMIDLNITEQGEDNKVWSATWTKHAR